MTQSPQADIVFLWSLMQHPRNWQMQDTVWQKDNWARKLKNSKPINDSSKSQRRREDWTFQPNSREKRTNLVGSHMNWKVVILTTMTVMTRTKKEKKCQTQTFCFKAESFLIC